MAYMQTMDLAAKLSRHGIRPSAQRLCILQYLVSTTSHPTADDVFQALLPEIPSLSKTTVYNTLNLLARENLARLLTIEDGEARYDGDVSLHGHFRCTHCGKVADFPVNIESLPAPGLENCVIKTKDVFFQGICEKCLENSK